MFAIIEISCECWGDFTQLPDGSYMIAFPWPNGTRHRVIVPEPYQFGGDYGSVVTHGALRPWEPVR